MFLKKKKNDQESSPSVDFLRGKLPWRIISVVFATILIVEASILAFRIQSFENQKLDELIDLGLSIVSPIIAESEVMHDAVMLLDNTAAQHVLATTALEGFAIYKEGSLVATDVYGETPLLSPAFLRGQAKDTEAGTYITWQSEDKSRYEAILQPKDIRADYHVVVRMNASDIPRQISEFIAEATIVALLLSAFVTTVLVLVLGKWLLEPILFLRANLLRATKDPKNPDKHMTRYKRKDELGSVIVSANRLIKQNAETLNQLNKQAEDRIYRLAYFDSLTGLPNRTHFIQKIDESIANEGNESLCLFVIDLDNFGDINDTLGYQAGDSALEMIGQKLSKALEGSIMTARLGEDEFAAIVKCEEADVTKYTDKVFGVFGNPLNIQGNEYFVEASIGGALYPKDAETAADLLKKAETALDQAKQEEKGTHRLYEPEFDQAVQSRIQMVRDLRVAVDEEQFSLMYQPQFDAKTQEIIGAEALIRWFKPNDDGTSSQVFPDQFIPVAEQSGLIVPIGKWVIYEAARFAKKCHQDGLSKFRVAVNISGVQFYRDDIVALTKQVLEDVGLEPQYLELEVTESAVMEDLEETIQILQNLKDLGVDLAIDDFGTGYSSLSYLKRFPIHRLKVDRSFVMDVTEDPDDAAITRTIIQLGHSMGLKVIAEGVETQDHVDFLLKEQCDEFQGYFFSKPLPASEFVGFVKAMTLNKKEHA